MTAIAVIIQAVCILSAAASFAVLVALARYQYREWRRTRELVDVGYSDTRLCDVHGTAMCTEDETRYAACDRQFDEDYYH